MNKSFARKVVALCCIVAVFACYRLDALNVKITNKTLGKIDVYVQLRVNRDRSEVINESISSGKSKVFGPFFERLSWRQEGSKAKWTARVRKSIIRAYITIYDDGYYKQGLGKKRRAKSDQGGPGYFDPILKRKK